MSNQSYIRNINQNNLSQTHRQQLQMQLLRAFDDQIQDNQNMERKSSLLPKGILNKNQSKKIHLKQQLSQKNYSILSKKNLIKQNKKITSRNLLLLKAIQQTQKNKYRYENSIHFRQQPTNRSKNSKTSMSSVKSFHLNKRKRIMTEFYQQKQTQKLVKRLLNVKPSQQVKKQVQLNSYQKHVMVKNIMMHRVSDQPIKKESICLRNKRSQGSTIDLKQQDLRKFLKEEKKKTQQQSKIKPFSNNYNHDGSLIYKRCRIQTLPSENNVKKQLYSKSSAIIPLEPMRLPNVKISTQMESIPIKKSLSFKDKYKTPLQSRNRNYF